VTTLRDIHRTASLISPQNASLLRQEDFSIISLQPIRAEESRTICLLATTSNGVRLYFTNQRSGYRAFTAPSTSLGGGFTLELRPLPD
jgi:nuclear pore complex protein Nup155